MRVHQANAWRALQQICPRYRFALHQAGYSLAPPGPEDSLHARHGHVRQRPYHLLYPVGRGLAIGIGEWHDLAAGPCDAQVASAGRPLICLPGDSCALPQRKPPGVVQGTLIHHDDSLGG
jgi:hypothetical protein